jgi:hypothetical protein
MSTTDDVLDALEAALAATFATAALAAPSRERALPVAMIELGGEGSEVYASLFDGDGSVDGVLLGGGEDGNAYELTQRAELDWAVSDHDPARRSSTFDAGLIAADEAAKALRTAVAADGHPLHTILSDVGIERIDRSRTVFEGIAHIKAATIVFALTFTSSRPF